MTREPHDGDRPELDDAELDALLDHSAPLLPSADLMRRVAQLPLTHPQPAGSLLPWPFRSFVQLALSGALVLGLGVLGGLWSTGTAQADDAFDDFAGLTLGDALELDDTLDPEEATP